MKYNMNQAKEEIAAFKKSLLQKYLDQCTDRQRVVFKLMYPGGPTEKQMEWAIQQCMNSVAINRAKPEVPNE